MSLHCGRRTFLIVVAGASSWRGLRLPFDVFDVVRNRLIEREELVWFMYSFFQSHQKRERRGRGLRNTADLFCKRAAQMHRGWHELFLACPLSRSLAYFHVVCVECLFSTVQGVIAESLKKKLHSSSLKRKRTRYEERGIVRRDVGH